MDSVSQSKTAATSDEDWLLNIQRKLYQWSERHPGESYRDLWNWVIDPRNLDHAFLRVATNKGSKTAGIDGITVKWIRKKVGTEKYLKQLHERLKDGSYQPSPVKRRWIPKPGKPDQFRGLGIPTVEDRIVQSAIKQIIEPIFEPRFLYVSQGFRPGRAVRDAIELARTTLTSRQRDEQGRKTNSPYRWVIEGDVKACFDHIDHHVLMNRVRRVISDRKVTRLIAAFLKAGFLEEENFFRTDSGTPQGGILSPLLANIALGFIEERYRHWVYPIATPGQRFTKPLRAADYHRYRNRKLNRAVFYPIRYADDFIILCSGTQEEALKEKEELAVYLREQIGVELSQEKTRVTSVYEGFDFLGHRIRVKWNNQWGDIVQAFVPNDRRTRLRERVKAETSHKSTSQSLSEILTKINPILRGWANFYRHTSRAFSVFHEMDTFVYWRILRWLESKHVGKGRNFLHKRHWRRMGKEKVLRWTEGTVHCFYLYSTATKRWNLKMRRLPRYMHSIGEPGA